MKRKGLKLNPTYVRALRETAQQGPLSELYRMFDLARQPGCPGFNSEISLIHPVKPPNRQRLKSAIIATHLP